MELQNGNSLTMVTENTEISAHKIREMHLKMTRQTPEMQLKMTGTIGNFQFLVPRWKEKPIVTSSQIFSNFGIQLVAKWQFCSTTQVPSLIALSIIFAAIGPWNNWITK